MRGLNARALWQVNHHCVYAQVHREVYLLGHDSLGPESNVLEGRIAVNQVGVDLSQNEVSPVVAFDTCI